MAFASRSGVRGPSGDSSLAAARAVLTPGISPSEPARQPPLQTDLQTDPFAGAPYCHLCPSPGGADTPITMPLLGIHLDRVRQVSGKEKFWHPELPEPEEGMLHDMDYLRGLVGR